MDAVQIVAPDAPRRGRPKGSKDIAPRMSKSELVRRIGRLQTIGAIGSTAHKVIAALGDAEYALRIISELEQQGDWGKLADIYQFYLQMRDGRPHQQINVTATNIHVSAEQIARARQVVRELSPSIRGELKAKPTDVVAATTGVGDGPNALEGQGVKKGGSV